MRGTRQAVRGMTIAILPLLRLLRMPRRVLVFRSRHVRWRRATFYQSVLIAIAGISTMGRPHAEVTCVHGGTKGVFRL